MNNTFWSLVLFAACLVMAKPSQANPMLITERTYSCKLVDAKTIHGNDEVIVYDRTFRQVLEESGFPQNLPAERILKTDKYNWFNIEFGGEIYQRPVPDVFIYHYGTDYMFDKSLVLKQDIMNERAMVYIFSPDAYSSWDTMHATSEMWECKQTQTVSETREEFADNIQRNLRQDMSSYLDYVAKREKWANKEWD